MYGFDMRHDVKECDQCRECAESALKGIRLSHADTVTSYLEGCFATAWREEGEDFARV